MAKAKKPGTVAVYIRLPKSLKKAIHEFAKEQKRSLASEVEMAIEAHLQKNSKWPLNGNNVGSGGA